MRERRLLNMLGAVREMDKEGIMKKLDQAKQLFIRGKAWL
jgi:hypothetical protein